MKLDEATEVWSQLDSIADRFDADWRERETPPPLAEYLPAEPAELRRITLVELIKIDLEYRWKQLGQPKRIEEYVAEFNELREELPTDLVFEEYQVRRRTGEDPKPAEYLERFPQHEEAIRKLLNVKDPQATTRFFNNEKPKKAQPGERIDDFELLVPLGEGAFAQVFLARQISMQRLLAVKLSSDRGDEPQTLAQLDHPNIVRVYDQRLLPERQQRILYMQHVPGGTLLDVLKRAAVHPPETRQGQVLLDAVRSSLDRAGQPVPPTGPAQQKLAAASWSEVVCRIGAQLALALDYAHEKGVLHRDVKPANVLLTADATPQLADFNISFSAAVEGATPAAYFGGSLAYMSPEQLEAANPLDERQPGELDGRSDLYSLAVLLWELVTTERPFHDEELADGWVATLQQMAERRQARAYGRPQAPPGDTVFAPLIQVLEECLEPDPARRPTDGRRLARELLLCTNPRARKLLSPGGKWRGLMRQHAVIACLVFALIPNALAAVFNHAYNSKQVIEPLVEASGAFNVMVVLVNGIAFPLCMVVLGWFVWPVAQMLKHKPRPPEEDQLDRELDDVDADHSASKRFPAPHPEPSVQLRARALGLGHLAAMISIAGWVAAAPVYPIAMSLWLDAFPLSGWFQFVASLTICGLIAAAYPFFIISRVALRTWYPALLALSTGGSDDEAQLVRLTRRAGAYLLVAGGVPLIGLGLLVIAGVTGGGERLVLGIMCGVGLAGLALAFWQYRETQRDVAALMSAALPEETSRVGGDSVDSFMG